MKLIYHILFSNQSYELHILLSNSVAHESEPQDKQNNTHLILDNSAAMAQTRFLKMGFT